ncbi:hypothetical protein [Pseudomonas simiae]
MSKPFDMELFMTGVLTGSNATRQRHTQQAKIIQSAISERWGRENPWTWQRKHLTWFLNHRMGNQKEATRYYYRLTIQLIAVRLGKKSSNI